MSKKPFLVVAALVAVIAAILAVLAALFYLKESIGPSDAAALAPEDAVLFVNLSNLPRTAVRWNETALAKIAAEPDVQAFLEKPLARLMADPGGNEAGKILSQLKPSNIFFAVAGESAESAEALVGFQYWGGRGAFDVAVARMRREMPGATTPAGEGLKHMNDTILSSTHGARSIFTATHGRWGFVATNESLIKQALDQVSGGGLGLSGNSDFQAVKARLPKDPEFLLFMDTRKVLDRLLAAGKTMGAEPIPAQVEMLRATKALGAALKLDGELQRDAIFLLRAGGKPGSRLNRKPLRFTGPDTAFYFDFLTRFDGLPALLQNAKGALPQSSEIPALAELAAAAYGPEGGIVGSWPSGRMAPAPLVVLEIRNPAKAGEFMQKMMTIFPDATTGEKGVAKVYSFPALSTPLAAPTLAQTGEFLLLGIDPSAVADAATAIGPAPTVESTPAFSGAVSAYASASGLFAFVDTRLLFERAYSALRPVIIFGAAVMPGAAEWVEPSKLPQTDSVARHLAPIVLSGQRLSDGILIESSGPITMNQAAFAIAAGIALSNAQTLLR